MQTEVQQTSRTTLASRLSATQAQGESANKIHELQSSPRVTLWRILQALVLGVCFFALPASAQSPSQTTAGNAAQPQVSQETIRPEEAADSTPPSIVNQPVNWVTTPGSDGSFSVTAQGAQPLKYYWSFNSAPLAGQNDATLVLHKIQKTDQGSYAVVVSNDFGAVTSCIAHLYLSNVCAWGAGASTVYRSPNFGQSLVPANLCGNAIAAGGFHSLTLQPDGTVAAWGINFYGVTNAPNSLTNAAAVAAGLYHSAALTSNGTVVAWGQYTYHATNVPTSATMVTALSAGWYHNLALRSNGAVVAWGGGTMNLGSSPNYGQTNVPGDLTSATAVAAGGYHSLALKSDSTVVAWGWNAAGQTNVPPGLSNVIAIAAGGSNSLALKSDGTLVAWGANSYGQTNIPAGLTNVVAIAAGAAHNMALKSDGTLVVWGLNDNGQTNVPAGLTNVIAISAGAYHCMAMVNVGPVTFLGQPRSQFAKKGGQAIFAPAFLGDGPLTCQWLLNGTNIPNATSPTLILPNLQFTDSGAYQIIVSNVFGAVTSAPAVLTVTDKAPYFTLQPTAFQWVLQNSSASLTAAAGGNPPIAYQWLLNGTVISGATNVTLTITNAQPTDEGNYSLVASNAYGSALSSNAFLDVVDIPQALGATNLVWQNLGHPSWFVESTNTHDGFAAAAVGPLTNGQQSVLLAVATGPGTLRFAWAPQLYISLTFCIDSKAQLAYGGSPWATPTIYLPGGQHVLTWLAANNNYSTATGSAFLDEVSFSPGTTPAGIVSQPISLTNAAGSNISFSVATSGTPPLAYQWYFNSVPIAGATGASCSINNIQSNNIGLYNAVVSNAYGIVVSSNAALAVTASAPAFLLQPTNAQAMAGSQVSFSGAATGTSPINYQWLHNGIAIPGATNTSLTLSPVQLSDGGNYALAATNPVGSAVSTNAYLLTFTTADLGAALDSSAITWSVPDVPWFPETNTTHSGISAAQSGIISDSQRSTLQAVVTGPATIVYWWKVNCDSFWDSLAFSINSSNQTSITGTVDWQPATNYLGAGSQTVQWTLYPVYGDFAGGTGWVDQVQLTPGGTAATVVSQPASLTTKAGNTVSFSIRAIGTPPLSYQWQLNGTNLPGATNSGLSLTNIQSANAGIYSATASNDYGFATSSNASLVITNSSPVITSQPSSHSCVMSSDTAFKVTVQGTSPLSYQWQFNGTPILGATSSTLSLTGLSPTNAGAYSVIITNSVGAATSAVAMLEVTSTWVQDLWPLGGQKFLAPFGLSNVTTVAAGAVHTVALFENGTVTAWGLNTYGQTNVPVNLSNVVAISAGYYHTTALKADGTVVSWGDNTYAQQLIPPGLTNVTTIAAGAYYTLALKRDGTIIGWGQNSSGQLNIPSGLTNVISIAAGTYNGFAVKADGTVVQWGNGPIWQSNGINTQLSVALGMSNIAAVAAGSLTAWSLDNTGTVWSWGWGGRKANFGVVTVAAADDEELTGYGLFLQDNGVPFISGIFSMAPFILPGMGSNIFAISAGYMHAAVVANDGTPRVAKPLANQTVHAGSTVYFQSGVVSGIPLSYQWQFNGTNLDGDTNVVLVLTNVPLTAAGSYSCLATNSRGAVTNLNATLTVLRSAPQFGAFVSTSPHGFGWQLNQLSGHGSIVIFASTNLVDWVPIFTNPPVTGSIEFHDTDSIAPPKRFYRAVEQ